MIGQVGLKIVMVHGQMVKKHGIQIVMLLGVLLMMVVNGYKIQMVNGFGQTHQVVMIVVLALQLQH